jgi:hypothetical protein
MTHFLVILFFMLLVPLTVSAAENEKSKAAKPKFDSSAIWGVRRGPNAKPSAAPFVEPAVSTEAAAEAEAMTNSYRDKALEAYAGLDGGGSTQVSGSGEQCQR